MKSKAVFMMFLILALPFYISSACAIVNPDIFPVSIKQVRIYGSQRNQTKAVLPGEGIDVEAIITDQNVQASQVKFVLSGSTINFQSCFADPQGTRCALVFTPPTALAAGIKAYSVTYTPAGANPITVSGNFIVDSSPPAVTAFGTKTGIVGLTPGGKVIVSYTAVDYAAGSSSTCAGIGGILVASDAAFTNIISDSKIDVSSIQDCTKTGQLEITAPVTDGTFTWYAKAYDRLGNLAYSVKSAVLTVDAVAPEVTDIRLFRGSTNTTLVAAGITGYSIRANVRETNGLASATISTGGQSSCVQLDANNYDCSWPIDIQVTAQTTSVSGTINVKDVPGNSKDYPFSIQVGVDIQAPAIGFFGSTYGSYLKAGPNTLYVHAQDPEGDPLQVQNVYADLHLLGSYSSQVQPNNCTKEYCYWYNIVTTKPSNQTANAKVWAGDSFGHYNSIQTAFKVDKVPPVINNIVRSVEFPTAQDEEYFYFIINASDSSGIRNVTVNMSAISNHKGLLISDCIDRGTSTICTVYSQELKTSYAAGNIHFTVYDSAGNIAEEYYPIIIYESDETTIPEEITDVDVKDVRPNLLDRKIATTIPVKIFLELKYGYDSAHVSILDQSANCVNLTPILYHTQQGSNPYWIGEKYLVFDILLNNLTAHLDKIKFNCTLSLKIRRDGVVFTNPEKQQLNAEVKLYNLPLGIIGDGTIKKVEDIHTIAEDWFGWAEDVDKWFQVAIKLCDMFGTFQQAYNIAQTFKTILYPICLGLHSWPPTTGVGNGLWKYYNLGTCYLKVGKDYAWPNSNPSNLGQYNQPQTGTGGGASFWYPTKSGGNTNIRGIVRNICSLVKCRQCNTDWGIANRLANWNLKGIQGGSGFWDQVYTSNASTRSTTLTGQLSSVGAGKGGWAEGVDLSVGVDPFRSWAVAAACFCIPGLIHNAKKYRQLECMHANCVIENAKAGFSTGPCDELDRERKCVFFWGALFHLIPGYLFAQMIISKVMAVIQNLPGRLINAATSWLCNDYDEAVSGESKLAHIDSTKDCQDLSKQPQTVTEGKNTHYIMCSVIDAGMLVWSWDDFVANAFNFKDYFNFEGEQDICKSVDWEAAGID